MLLNAYERAQPGALLRNALAVAALLVVLGGAASGAPAVAGPTTAAQIVSGIKGLISPVSNFVKDNQLLSAMGVMGLSNMLNAKEMADQEEDARERRERNLLVGDIDLGFPSSGGRPLRRLSTGQPVFDNGLINRAAGQL